MNTFLILPFLLLTCCLTTQAQGVEPQFFPHETKHVQIISQKKAPLVIIASQETTPDALILHPDEIQHMNVYKGEEAVEKYGEKGKAGVVVMELKETVPLARLPEIYEQFRVTKQGQKLSVAINGRHVSEPELLLADLRQIKKVEVRPFDVLSPSRWSFDEEYLNIVTVQ